MLLVEQVSEILRTEVTCRVLLELALAEAVPEAPAFAFPAVLSEVLLEFPAVAPVLGAVVEADAVAPGVPMRIGPVLGSLGVTAGEVR